MEQENSTNENSESVAVRGQGGGMRGPVPQNDGSDGSSNSTSRPTPPTDGAAPEEFDGEMPEMCDPSDDDCEMPELPEGEAGMMGGPGGFGGGEFTTQPGYADETTLHPVAYLAMGGCSVILSIVIVYAYFSKCFHLKPGQTFNTAAKFIWACVAALVLAAGLITLCYFIPIWIQ